jgi:hypothetical protein
MATQYTVGVEQFVKDDPRVVDLLPKRLTERALQSMPHAKLVTLRNASALAEQFWQDREDGRRLMARTARFDAEIERRGLREWMENPCSVCGERRDLGIVGKDELLFGECACDRALNTSGVR